MSGGSSLPPGFRFHPTDEELIDYYLKRKVEGLRIELEVIPMIDLYKYDPWELPELSFLGNADMEWFFFCPRDRKYPHGSRTNRATRAGYWKATGKDRKVVCQSSLVGYRKTLVFYTGRAPYGERMDWLMHEYRLSDDNAGKTQGAFALCRVLKRTCGSKSINTKATSSAIVSEPSHVSDESQPLTNATINNAYPYKPVAESSEPNYTHNPHFWVSPNLNKRSSAQEGVSGTGENMFSFSPENFDYMSIWGNDDVICSLLNNQNLLGLDFIKNGFTFVPE